MVIRRPPVRPDNWYMPLFARDPLRSTLLRFGVVSLLPIMGLGWFVNSTVRDNIESHTAAVYGSMSEIMFLMASDALVRPEDFATGQPLPPERAQIIDDLLKRVGPKDSSVRLRMLDRERRVIYANFGAEPHLALPPSKDLWRALAGDAATRFVRRAPDGSGGKGADLIEVFIPVRLGADPTVHGAIVASGLDTTVITTIDRDVRRMQLSLGLGLLALWLSMLPIAASVSRALRKKAAENEHLALHDTLTGLPNRNLVSLRLDQAIAHSRRTGDGVGLLLLDLDRFKEVNDTLGHGRGDRLLQLVAARLAGIVAPGDSVARLGGDEFCMIVTGIVVPDDLREVAQRVTGALTGAMEIDSIDVAIEATIGGAVYPHHAADAEELLQYADVAMYSAKASGDSFALYATELDSHSPIRLALAADLGRALACDDQLVLHYQPVASATSGRVRSVEALIRWQHPTRGLLQPIDFVPMAEQSGLIEKLSSKALDMALAQAREWLDHGLDLTMAVNLSAADLRSMKTLDIVGDALARHGMPADHLELEVTETGFLTNPDAAVALVTSLRALGVRIALDDFGTGYSSLTHLKRLRPDRLKIDRSFVEGMAHDVTDANIVRSIIELAHSLGMVVTAEGVETRQHWELLVGQACDHVQGYYLARPLDARAATSWLDEQMRRPGASLVMAHQNLR